MNWKLKFSLLALLAIFFSTEEVIGQQWLGSTNSTGIIYHSGTVSSNQQDETGFAVSAATHKSDWGGLWYGISQGNTSKFELDWNPNSSKWADPVLVQGFWGLGFRTDRGKMTMARNGVVTIGLSDSRIESISEENWWHFYKLYVGGGIRTQEVRVDPQTAWPDYVFKNDYKLMKISEVESFIKSNSHLPNVPPASEVEKNGFDLGDMDTKILRQVEELWLHVIQLNKEVEQLKKENEALKASSN